MTPPPYTNWSGKGMNKTLLELSEWYVHPVDDDLWPITKQGGPNNRNGHIRILAIQNF